MDEVWDHRWVQFVVLASQEHRSDAKELELGDRKWLKRQVAVNDVNGHLYGLRQESELDLDDYKPVHEDLPVLRLDIDLPVKQIAGVYGPFLISEKRVMVCTCVVFTGVVLVGEDPEVEYDDFIGLIVLQLQLAARITWA